MGGQAVRWTAEQVLALAPDDASRRAGSKLSAPGPWTEAGTGSGAIWGLCKGSGSRPYQTVIDLDGGNGPGYKCSCPSRKFPCKHAVGLLLLWAGDGTAVTEAPDPPEWAGSWLSGRRQRAERKPTARGAGGTEGVADPDTEGDRTAGTRDRAARQRAEQRAARMAAGAQELEQRLTDLVRGGLAGADQAGYAPWEEMAARMVDAQAPGLATRVRELGAIPASGAGWPERLLAECALLHLLTRGFQRVGELPQPLADTVRSRVGLTVEAAELLADGSARIRDTWLVLAQHDTEEGRLTARRVWLTGRASGRTALLLSFGVAGRPPELALPVGTTLDSELAYYPGAVPLRAALGERFGAPGPGFRPAGGGIPEAVTGYAAALCEDPWLDGMPSVLHGVLPLPPDPGGPPGWQLIAADGDHALPLAPGTPPSALWKLTAISADGPLTVFGECGHQGFAPHTAWTDHQAIPL